MHRIASVTRKSALVVATLSALLVSGRAMADINGFGDGSDYTLNGYNSSGGPIVNDPATISGGVLGITSLTVAQARSAFYNTPQNVLTFTASFIFQDKDVDQSPIGAPDGFAFVVQNQGPTAVSGQATGLGVNNPDGPSGVSPILPSAGVEFFLRNGNGATTITNNGSGEFIDGVSTAPVDLADGDPIQVTLVYDGPNFLLTENLLDLTTLESYTLTRAADFHDIVGTSAFVGFTGATGGAFGNQEISNFLFVSAVPEPASLGMLAVAGAGLTLRRRRK